MFTSNPFYILTESIAPIFMQIFVILMIALIVVGTVMDMIHKKNVKYFFENAKKQKKCNQSFINRRKNKSFIKNYCKRYSNHI